MSGRLFVMSDIHGHKTMLHRLLQIANYDPVQDTLVLLGDYVHKGPESLETLHYIRQLKNNGAIVIRGNHEDKLIKGVKNEIESPLSPEWYRFLSTLPYYYEDRQFIYVHAGIRPGIPLKLQAIEDLTTIREDFFFNRSKLPKPVIFGHTPTYRLGASIGEIWIDEDKVGIDTGAGEGLFLSLIDLTYHAVYQCNLTTKQIVKNTITIA
ncbi:metallophosphoesterase family protein [Halalkalibacter hemicellulosilyticus]|uniref:Serine/threonine protein phosphatase n=1 Tax=Halalkalibacter hemicellulosilyticusJCM 9152 TaxID=1236971 RepID=W4QD09_9BACI|nr:metallophosphoesterase family protein [Halalkalibacter hemicellulosilyticus]GAE29568.1 serine/threonine protein phosphatase [Halalkalibacter hemicellulosilyticusJCM 9152]